MRLPFFCVLLTDYFINTKTSEAKGLGCKAKGISQPYSLLPQCLVALVP